MRRPGTPLRVERKPERTAPDPVLPARHDLEQVHAVVLDLVAVLELLAGRRARVIDPPLNTANLQFCAMMAGLVGLPMGSWTWFAPAAIVIVAASVHSGDIGYGPPADVPGRAADGADQDQCAMGPSPARAMV